MKKFWLMGCFAAFMLTAFGLFRLQYEEKNARHRYMGRIADRLQSYADSLALVGRVIAVSSQGRIKPKDDYVLNLLNQYIFREPAAKGVFILDEQNHLIARNTFDPNGLYVNDENSAIGTQLEPSGNASFQMNTGKFGIVGADFNESTNKVTFRKTLQIDDNIFGQIALVLDTKELIEIVRKDYDAAEGAELVFVRKSVSEDADCWSVGIGATPIHLCSKGNTLLNSHSFRTRILSFLVTAAIVYISAAFIMLILILPLRKILYALKADTASVAPLSLTEFFGPLKPVASLLNEYTQLREANHALRLDVEKSQITKQIASQISHDIRSPLSALNFAVERMEGVSEENRHLVQSAIKRINGIANDLLKESRDRQQPTTAGAEKDEEARKLVLQHVKLSEVVTTAFIEKKLEWGQQSDVHFDLDLGNAESAFCRIDSHILARVLSNLLNNAYDARDGHLKVKLSMRAYGSQTISIVVSDDGKGIPPQIVDKLGKERVSHGKAHLPTSGTGLGVYHAKTSVEGMGGKFLIQSRENLGTLVTLSFPQVIPSELNLRSSVEA